LACTALAINCDLCFNKSICIICNTGFVFFNVQCLSTIPPGYVNISGTAQPCTGDCATCSVIQSNCTSCKTMNLIGNQCMANCPSGYAPISAICTVCSSPCSTCSQSVTNCTSCLSNITPTVYLSNNNCVYTCPTFTYSNNIIFVCSACVNPCVTCTSQVQCLSCNSTTNLYQTSCLSTCPTGYTSIAQVCVACLSPCASCSTSQSTCLSCLSTSNLFLTGTSCVVAANCPTSTYANLTNNVCTLCVPPCLTCTSASVCLTCIADYNLEGTLCKSNCLSG
jgi:proprotein convertase subtilisin/kexin type 5